MEVVVLEGSSISVVVYGAGAYIIVVLLLELDV